MRECKSKATATTAHAEAPAWTRPAWTLALAFSTSCLALSTSRLASLSSFLASLSSCLTSSAFSLLLSSNSSSCFCRYAVRSSASSRARRAAARSCRAQGCFPVRLPFADHICLRFWLEPPRSSAAARPAPTGKTICRTKSRSANQQHARTHGLRVSGLRRGSLQA